MYLLEETGFVQTEITPTRFVYQVYHQQKTRNPQHLFSFHQKEDLFEVKICK